MPPIAFSSLATAVGWSLLTALIAQLSVSAAAVVAAVGILVAVKTRLPHKLCGLCALPILLVNMPVATVPRPAFKPGPAWIEGHVRSVERAPLRNRCFVRLSKEVRITFPGECELLPGDKLRVLAQCGSPAIPGRAPPLRAIPETAEIQPGCWSMRRICARLRRALERRLLEIVPGEHGAMLATLVLGRATRPDSDLAQAHRATGLSHLLAVSGAHAAMLAMLLGLSSRGRHLGASRLRSALVMGILLVYGGIAGAEPPVLRAIVAYALSAIAARIGRPCSIATCLLVPAWLTALLEPQALLGPSFLLSYAAVIGLSLASQGPPPDTKAQWIISGLRASFWATLLTAPLTLAFFGQLAPWTIILTPICAPLVAMMLLLGLIAPCLSMMLPQLTTVLGWPLEAMATSYAWLVTTADGLPGTPVPALYTPPFWAIALLATAAASIVAWHKTKRSLIIAVAALASLYYLPLQASYDACVLLLAVGHGQAALVTDRSGHQMIVDCGSLQGGYLAARRIEESLTRRTIDLLVITHSDQDHHNGVPFLLARLRILRALLPQHMAASPMRRILEEHGCVVSTIAPGRRASPTAGVQVLAPDLPITASDNDQSLWLKTSGEQITLLMTGDAQELGIASALQSDFVTQCEVLVLPHHGRRSANAHLLLARARPRDCLASASSSDGQTQLSKIVQHFDADLWATGIHGTIRVDLDRSQISPESFDLADR